jgi:hypothetical protein
MTDVQLYHSRLQSVSRSLIEKSALLRVISNYFAYASVQKFNQKKRDNPLTTIGLEGTVVPRRLFQFEGGKLTRPNLNERSLGQRVSEEERRQILSELIAFCKEHQIALIVIHPAYRDSTRHSCVLTQVCEGKGAPVFEAFEQLHPAGLPPAALYREQDPFHPNAEGHRRLAAGLADFIAKTFGW